MTITVADSGTQSATLTTEHTLTTLTDAGVYQLHVDTNNHALADILVLRTYIKVRSTTSSILLHRTTVPHIQANKVAVSVPVPTVHEVKFTLTQTNGTGRSYDWAVYDLGGTPVETDSGSQTATLSEDVLKSVTDAKTHICFVDCSNMVNGDQLILRAKLKTLTGSTKRRAYTLQASDVQLLKAKMFAPIATAFETEWTEHQTAGTARAFPWSVVEL